MLPAPLALWNYWYPGCDLFSTQKLVCSDAEGSRIDGMPFPAWLRHYSVGLSTLSGGAPLGLQAELHL